MKTFKQFMKEQQNVLNTAKQSGYKQLQKDVLSDPANKEVWDRYTNAKSGKTPWTDADRQVPQAMADASQRKIEQNPGKYFSTTDTELIKRHAQDDIRKDIKNKLPETRPKNPNVSDFTYPKRITQDPTYDPKIDLSKRMDSYNTLKNSAIRDDTGKITGINPEKFSKQPITKSIDNEFNDRDLSYLQKVAKFRPKDV